MANGMYAKALQAFLAGDLDWDADDIKAALVDTADYTVNFTTNQYLSSVGWTAIEASCSNFTNKSVTNGVADADNITFSAVTGDPCEAVVIFKDTGNINTSPLICCITSAVGLPVTPNGGDIDVTWNDGANKIFNLGATCP